MEFWNSILTEKSWNILVELNKDSFDFILIGGWAAYLWTSLHKSKDVDIVLEDLKTLDYLKKKYGLKKNDNLKKYEIQFEEIDVDIYVPFYSKLAIPVEDIKKYATKIKGLKVVKPEALLILKQGAELERKESVKGDKDRIDIMTLLIYSEVSFKEYESLLKLYELEHYLPRLKTIIKTFKDIQYLNLNPRQFKLKKEQILTKL
ncbi:hypothetical protein FJZ53_03020 [Candidatus Woesearchaeota archaeon]|nr:hypothetical protein [Candidatus Woesearchaeota archaeon]